MTLEELKTHGYEVRIHGRTYELIHNSQFWRDELSKPTTARMAVANSHFVQQQIFVADEWEKHALNKILKDYSICDVAQAVYSNAKPISFIRGETSGPLLADEDFLGPRVILRGTIQQNNDYRRKGRGSFPIHGNQAQIIELCVKAATIDFVKRRVHT